MKKNNSVCVLWLVSVHLLISISSLTLPLLDNSLRSSARTFRKGLHTSEETRRSHRTKRYIVQDKSTQMKVNAVEEVKVTASKQSVEQSLQLDNTANSIRQLEGIIAECQKTPIRGACHDIYTPHNYFADFDIPSETVPSKKGIGDNVIDAEEEAKEKRERQQHLIPRRVYQTGDQNLDTAGNSLAYPVTLIDETLISDIIRDPSVEDIVFIRRDVQNSDLEASLKNKCENAAKQLHILKKLQAIHNDIKQKNRQLSNLFSIPTQVKTNPGSGGLDPKPIPISPIQSGESLDVKNLIENFSYSTMISEYDNGSTESSEIPKIFDPQPEIPDSSTPQILSISDFPEILSTSDIPSNLASTTKTPTDSTVDPPNLLTTPFTDADFTPDKLSPGSATETPTEPTGDVRSLSTVPTTDSDSTTKNPISTDSNTATPIDPAGNSTSLSTTLTTDADSTTAITETSTGDLRFFSTLTTDADSTAGTTEAPTEPLRSLSTLMTDAGSTTPITEDPTNPTGDPRSLSTPMRDADLTTATAETPTDPTGDPRSLSTLMTDTESTTAPTGTPTDPTGDTKSLSTFTPDVESTTASTGTPTDPTGDPKSLSTLMTDTESTTASTGTPTDSTGDSRSLSTHMTDAESTAASTETPTDPTGDPKSLSTLMTDADSTAARTEAPMNPTGDPRRSTLMTDADVTSATTETPLGSTGAARSFSTTPTTDTDLTTGNSLTSLPTDADSTTATTVSFVDSTVNPRSLSPTFILDMDPTTNNPSTVDLTSEIVTDPTVDPSIVFTTPTIDTDPIAEVTKRETSTNSPIATLSPDAPEKIDSGQATVTNDQMHSTVTDSTAEVTTTDSTVPNRDKSTLSDDENTTSDLSSTIETDASSEVPETKLTTQIPSVYSTLLPPEKVSESGRPYHEEISLSNHTKLVYETQLNETVIHDFGNDAGIKETILPPTKSNPGVIVSPIKSNSSEMTHVDLEKPPIYSDDLKIPNVSSGDDGSKNGPGTKTGDPSVDPTIPSQFIKSEPSSSSNKPHNSKSGAESAGMKDGPLSIGDSQPSPKLGKPDPETSSIKPSAPGRPSTKTNSDDPKLPSLPLRDFPSTEPPENDEDKRELGSTDPTPSEVKESKSGTNPDSKGPIPGNSPNRKGSKPASNSDNKKLNPTADPNNKDTRSGNNPGTKGPTLDINVDKKGSVPSVDTNNKELTPVINPNNKESVPIIDSDNKGSVPDIKGLKPVINLDNKKSNPTTNPNKEGANPSINSGTKRTKPGIDPNNQEIIPTLDPDSKGSIPNISPNSKGLLPSIQPDNKATTPRIDLNKDSKPSLKPYNKGSVSGIDPDKKGPNSSIHPEIKGTYYGISPDSKEIKPSIESNKGTIKFPDLPKIDVNSLHNTPLSDLALYISQRNNSASAALKDKIDQAFHHAEVNLPMDLGPLKTDENDEDSKSLTNDPKKISQKELKSKIELAVPNAIVADGLLNTFFIILLSNNATKLNLERWTEDMPAIEVDDLCVPLYENGAVHDFLSITRLLKGTVYFKNSRFKVPIRIKRGAERKCSSLSKYGILKKSEGETALEKKASADPGNFRRQPDFINEPTPSQRAGLDGLATGSRVPFPMEPYASIGSVGSDSGKEFSREAYPRGEPVLPRNTTRNVASNLQIDPGIQFPTKADHRSGPVSFGGNSRYSLPVSPFNPKARFVREPKPGKGQAVSAPKNMKRPPPSKGDRKRIPREGSALSRESSSNVVGNWRVTLSPSERNALLERFLKMKSRINEELDSFIDKPVPLFEKSDFVNGNKR